MANCHVTTALEFTAAWIHRVDRKCRFHGTCSFPSPISRIYYYPFRSYIIYLHTLFLAVKVIWIWHNFLNFCWPKCVGRGGPKNWARSKLSRIRGSLEEAEKFFRGSRKQMYPDSRAGNLQKNLEVHVCHVSMVNRKLEARLSHGLSWLSSETCIEFDLLSL